MPFSVDGLTPEDFLASGWRTVIDLSTERRCDEYEKSFFATADAARIAGDARRENILRLLGDICSMFIVADDIAEPLRAKWQFPTSRSAIPSDFDPALAYLAEILPFVDDPDLAARVADVLWVRNRDFRAARRAVDCYLDAVDFVDVEDWHDSAIRVERSIAIAAEANQIDLLKVAVARVEESLDKLSGHERSFFPLRLMQLLETRKVTDPGFYATLSGRFAAASENRKDWRMARDYWDCQADWCRIAKDDEGVYAARLKSVDTYVAEANERLGSELNERHLVATHFLEKAIHALRALGGHEERVAKLHSELLAQQKLAVREMSTVSGEIDVTDMMAYAIRQVKGKSLYDAIFALALLSRPRPVLQLRELAEHERSAFVYARYVSRSRKNIMGRTIARQERAVKGETQDEADLRAEMYKIASTCQALQGTAMIEPARVEFLREHTISVADLLPILRDNPFVPTGREELFALGLHAGFRGDFATAIHYLMPQVEHSITYVLEQLGGLPSGFDNRGIQREPNLNQTLTDPEFVAPLSGLLGEDTLFDLRALLIEGHGANLRNDLAHGLLDYDAFFSGTSIYFWRVVLRLCCQLGILARQPERVDSTSEDNHEAGSS